MAGVDFTCNGAAVTVRDDHPHLLAALREELDVTSPKDGCSPSGQCGCCTVLIDGKAVVSCQQSLAKVAGKEIVTLEGLPDDERQRYADAFAACGGLQCGFCIPGIIVRAKAQVDKMRTWPATSVPTCAAALATSRSSTPSRPSPPASR
jgi:aerobic-type carbon monoxide dehydrogenase small subunit (CoxS/CutS family)